MCLSQRVIHFLGLGLAALLMVVSVYILESRWSLPSRNGVLPYRSTRLVHGRWINGRYLRFEDEVTAGAAKLAKDARQIAGKSVDSDPGIATDRALLALLDGKTASAMVILQKSLKLNPNNPGLLNNIAVVELVKADRGDSYSLVGALNALDQCLNNTHNLKEGLFNRALALEELSLRSSALSAWAHYVRVESDDSWIKIAQGHLSQVMESSLEQKWLSAKAVLQSAAERGEDYQVADLVAEFPQPSRILVQETLLPQWANDRLSGNEVASSRELSIARKISEAIFRYNGEASAADAVKEVARADQKGQGYNLAQGYLLFHEGLDAYQNLQSKKAFSLFQKARKIFKSTECYSLLLWTQYWLAATKYYLGQRQVAEAELGLLLSSPKVYRYRALRGRALWSLGLIMLVRSELSASLQRYEAAAREFEQLGEGENLGAVQALLAENLHVMGLESESWQMRILALGKLSFFPSSVRLHNVLSETAYQLVSSNSFAAALYFHTEDIRVSRRIGNPATIAEALLGRGRDLLALGHVNSAWSDIREAQNKINSISDEPTRERLQADSSVAAGELANIETAPILAKSLDSAIDYYEKSGILPLVALAHLLRANVLLILGRESEAEYDLNAAIDLHEAAVVSISNQDARVLYRAQWQSVFDQMIDLEAIRRKNPEAALRILEYARSGQRFGLSRASIEELLRKDEVLVEYAVTRGKLLIWIMAKNANYFVVATIEESRLKDMVERFEADLKNSSDTTRWRSKAKMFSRYIVAPVVARIPNAKVWFLVPDRSLARIPFSCLPVPVSGHYLVQDLSVIYEPSVSRWATVRSRVGSRDELERGNLHLLAVGAQITDRKAQPGLEDLPGVAAEVQEIASLYSRKTVLLGREATVKRVLYALVRADVVHLAGHAVVADERTSLPEIFLAPGGGNAQSSLSSKELSRLDLSRVRLFLISACDAASSGAGDRDGAPGFADALLGAGVSSLVAARWSMPDAFARDFFVTLHRKIVGGLTAAEALRSTQLQAIHAGQGPRIWAMFEVFGDA